MDANILKRDSFCNVDKQTLFTSIETDNILETPFNLMMPNKIHEAMN